ncbi:uncharacterized protein K02A2.6-like [Eupeodes corollae]|uniref:uncharacterized protein K02A2.6-like n=1 Tax=Eupeodes corollae TaxID=290404 RepID=UPI00248F4BFD|nr:uncharacterized protein K02A2.6-like [Eupeodes corollae]
MYLKENVVPAFRAKRPVPYASLPAIDEELSRSEQSGFLTPVNFSDWATPVVAVRKANGSLRICADYSTGLNDALQPHHHPLPLPEDIFIKHAGGKIFSHIDLSDTYLQVEIEDELRYLGHELTGDGLQPDPEKAKAIMTMPEPQNISQLRSWEQSISMAVSSQT